MVGTADLMVSLDGDRQHNLYVDPQGAYDSDMVFGGLSVLVSSPPDSSLTVGSDLSFLGSVCTLNGVVQACF